MTEETIMSRPLELLIYRLIQRGFSPDHISRLVRDVIRIIGQGGVFTTRLVNVRLGQLGWDYELLDEASFIKSIQNKKTITGWKIPARKDSIIRF